VSVGAETVGFIVNPVAFINIAISVIEGAFAIGLVVLPFAGVPCPIRPDLGARAEPDLVLDVAPVDRAIIEDHLIHVL